MELHPIITADSVDQNRARSASVRREPDPSAILLKKGRSIIVIIVLSLVLFVNSVASGILTVGIPHIAADLELSESLVLW